MANKDEEKEQRRDRSSALTVEEETMETHASPIEKEEDEVFSSDLDDTSNLTSPMTENPTVDGADDPLHGPSFNLPKRAQTTSTMDTNDGDASIPKPFERSASPSTANRNKAAEYEKVSDQGVGKMHKYTVYETASRFYIVAADILDERFRILKIDRTDEVGDLNISEDEIVYTKREMSALLNTIDDGNKSTGGLKMRNSTWGILGFIRFTGHYYMLMITKRSQVALIGGHYIYQIDGTELVPLTPGLGSKSTKPDTRNAEEARFLGILNNLDLSRSFYFSYSYDITHTLQHTFMRERDALSQDLPYPRKPDYNSMFVWNSYLLQPASSLKSMYDWCIPIIHGYVDQSSLSVYGRSVWITIIARRSRFFAGARFLKRGANDLGYVANDVETEQIVCDSLTTSFHAPGPKLYANPNYTSYVQHRGSIPLYWTQDNTGVTPKPPIELNLVDPFYSAAALHFDNLFERYGAPIYVLNLVKTKERTPRESKLLAELTNCINYLNQFLPEDKKIIHKAWDMSRASKLRNEDVIGTLEQIADDVLNTTGFFRNGDGEYVKSQTQNGVARTNCIDCLDRTNAAQFVIGKRALGLQLTALGVISLAQNSLDYDTDAVNLFTHMYHDHGDTIAVQYGGSHLVNTMETYRKINQWTSHSRDMVESFKRYYNNSFLDGQRQEAYNLFLGNYVWAQGKPMLWDLSTDYYLHHADPRKWLQQNRKRRNYIMWYTPKFLEPRNMKDSDPSESPKPKKDKLLLKNLDEDLEYFDNYWLEYYKPLSLSSFPKIFAYKMNSTTRYTPVRSAQDGKYDLSPFKVRTELDQDVPEKALGATGLQRKKGVTIVDPNDEVGSDNESIRSNRTTRSQTKNANPNRMSGLSRWLQPINEQGHHGIMKEPTYHSLNSQAQSLEQQADSQKVKLTTLDKSNAAQWSFRQVVQESLNPSVTEQEIEDYKHYIGVVVDEVEVDELAAYVSGAPSRIGGSERFWGGYDNTILPVPTITTTSAENASSFSAFGATPSSLAYNGYTGYNPPSVPSRPTIGSGISANIGTGIVGSGITSYSHAHTHSQLSNDIQGISEFDLMEFVRNVEQGKVENPLDVNQEDAGKKRYKAYGKWLLRGKSLFKQQPVDNLG